MQFSAMDRSNHPYDVITISTVSLKLEVVG